MTLTQISLPTPTGDLTALARKSSGFPLVLLHGAMADAAAWRKVAEALAPERDLLVPHRRGRAPSPPLTDAYGLEQEVADLEAWLDTIDGPVDLVGHSYGGLIATEAVRRGAAIRSLVLYDPVTHPFAVESVPALAEAVGAGDFDRAVEIINVDVSGYTREHVDSLRATAAWPILRHLAVPSAAEARAINGHTLAPLRLAEHIGVTVLAGETSRHRPPYGPSVDAYVGALGVGDAVILPGQDHLAHVTSPRQLADAIEAAIPAPD